MTLEFSICVNLPLENSTEEPFQYVATVESFSKVSETIGKPGRSDPAPPSGQV